MSEFANNQERQQHKRVMQDFLHYLNEQRKDGQYVLKGGTSLMLCYGLNRFSEDIDLDQIGEGGNIIPVIERFCQTHGYDFRIAKNTPVVQRCMVHYSQDRDDILLKIEVSRRAKEIDPDSYKFVDGVCVYNIDTLALLKNNAFQQRTQLRDLFDACFICNNYFNELQNNTKTAIRSALSYRGLDYADWIIQTQSDPLVDPEQLATSVLEAFDVCGLIDQRDDECMDLGNDEECL